MHQQFLWKKLQTPETITAAHSNGAARWCVCVDWSLWAHEARIRECLKVYGERLRYDTGENELSKRNEYAKMSERKSRAQKSESTNRKKCWRYMHWIEYLKRCNKSTHSRQHELYIFFRWWNKKQHTHTHRVRENGAEHIARMKWMQKHGREKEKRQIKRKREKNVCQQDEHAQHF